MDAFQEKIGYRFNDDGLLLRALTHSSFGYEHQCAHNERLEFLGDSILGYVVSRELFKHFPKEPEGTLSKLKSVLVSSRTLAKKARDLGLGESIRFGVGERKAGGRKKSSILADAVEALIGAIALDGGLSAADHFILNLFGDEISTATIDIKHAVDFKTLLQERLQELGAGLPNYTLHHEEGPAHDRTFYMRVNVGDFQGPVGTGSSKKNAQQDSARQLLENEAFWQALRDGQTAKATANR